MSDKHHQADLDRVSDLNHVTDFARDVEERPRGGGLFSSIMRSAVDATSYGQAMHGRTSFEHYDLNEMVDLVKQTNPEDLESSGKALWDARDAIKAAAEELSGHISTVQWSGESGEAFRDWGGELVLNTHALSVFAGGAGDQITAAAVGLASVRSAMPAPDTQAARKRPEKFTETEKAANKGAYAVAVRVEKDRQEAINQMNRLSSYYAVSRDQLVELNKTAPEFKTMPNVGVPKPKRSEVVAPGKSAPGSTGTTAVAGHHTTVKPAGNSGVRDTSGTPTAPKHVVEHVTHPDVPVGTNIDSVRTLPPSTVVPTTSHNAPAMGTPTAGGGPNNAFETGFGTPIPSGLQGRGADGSRYPASAQGRAGTPGVSNSSTGRSNGRGPTSQMGRATETGRSLGKGPVSGAKPSAMGRGGVTGGTPRAGGTAAPRVNGAPSTGAGRANGVVGGRPANEARNSAKGGSRIPRGTVVGAEETANSRPATGRPGQRGVFGAPDPATGPRSNRATTARTGAGASETVTGRPTARNSVAGAERNGMTRGGTGLVRGPGNQSKPDDRRDAERAARPDYLVEDEETHLPAKPRCDVPPAVN
ncbi:hypothetical protein OH768_14880 [Streptomyces sp. NBC_01622]|uniref:WXG100 family type VII secretion target n=1 Tax=Streptomyces sp. NBC_01622 TaxID=2975903 RepID=UPI003867C0B7|nr:hypothetical protein OH768_14880 [Streptomyces sp. NBC_01622]